MRDGGRAASEGRLDPGLGGARQNQQPLALPDPVADGDQIARRLEEGRVVAVRVAGRSECGHEARDWWIAAPSNGACGEQ